MGRDGGGMESLSSPLLLLKQTLPPHHFFLCLAKLQRLRRLVLNGSLAGGRLPPEFGALQGLRHLELRACRLRALPCCVASLGSLTCLDLGINALTGLPGRWVGWGGSWGA